MWEATKKREKSDCLESNLGRENNKDPWSQTSMDQNNWEGYQHIDYWVHPRVSDSVDMR